MEPETVSALVRRLALAVERYVQSVGHDLDLARSDVHALGAVKGAERAGRRIGPSAIGREVGLSSPATTALLDRLVRAGHLERTRAAHDGRRIEVLLTPTAADTSRRAFGPLVRALDDSAARLADDEREVVERFLLGALAAVDEADRQRQAEGQAPPVEVADVTE